MGLHFKGQGHSNPHSPGSYTVMRPIRRLPQGVDSASLPVFIPPTANKSHTLSSKIIPTFTRNLADNDGLPANPGRQSRPSREPPCSHKRGENCTAVGFALSFPLPTHSLAVCSPPSQASHTRCQTSCLSVCPSLPSCPSVVRSHLPNVTRTATLAVLVRLLNLDRHSGH